MKIHSLVATVPFVICLNACKTIDVDSGNGRLMGMKDRAILVSRRPATQTSPPRTIVCAEPSPDALTAFAAGLTVPDYQASSAVAASFQASPSYVGLRTPTIQLLRDAQYRLCEAYMAGALDNQEYQWLLRRYQRDMVALLSIEELKDLFALMPTVSDMRYQLSVIDGAIKDLESQRNGATADQEKAADLTKKIAEEKDKRSAVLKRIEDAGSASGTPLVSDQSIKYVSDHIYEIAEYLIEAPDEHMYCMIYMRNAREKKADPLMDKCKSVLESYLGNTKEKTQVLSALRKRLESKDPKLTQDEINLLKGLLDQ